MKKPRRSVFYGVGIGPGDPELITLKALRILESSPVIAVPKATDEASSTALNIAKQAVSFEKKEVLELSLPMTRDAAELLKARKKAISEIAGRIQRGDDVAFITLGDPMLYSTFSYLARLLKKTNPDVDVRVSPGITSFCAASSSLGVPLAEGDERVAIMPAVRDDKEIEAALKAFDTVIFMKAHKSLDRLIDAVTRLGLQDKAFFVAKTGWPDEVIQRDLASLKGSKPGYFSMVIVKK